MQRFVLAAVVVASSLASSLAGCSSETSSGAPATAMFAVPASLDELAGPTFFDHPFPSDLRRDPDGTARLTGYPNPREVKLLDEYVAEARGLLHGFSPLSAIYLRFTESIAASSLPATPPASLTADSAVQIVDVDPASPERGKRHLAVTRVYAADGVYVPKHTLAVMPMTGAPLRPKTRYAVVVTTRARAESGGAVLASGELEEVIGLREPSDRTRAAREIYAPAVAELANTGVTAKDIAHLAVFTTADPTEETFAVLDDVKTTAPPKARDWHATLTQPELDLYEGTYGPTPIYQAGTSPYRKPADGGGFIFANGKPVLQGSIDLRFAISVPNANTCPPPIAGYPIVLYAHGTGGDYRSFVDDGTARSLAAQCLATIGIDQVLHGTRPGAPAENDPNRDSIIQLNFFNFENPLAARTHNRQAAADFVQLARLFTDSNERVPAAVSATHAEISFDASRVLFFGHSQGGLNGPLFLAGSDAARGGVLSGAAGVFGIALLQKTKPFDIPSALRVLVGLDADEGKAELDLFHPVMTLTQTMIDAADPINYADSIIRAPRPGHAPKSIYQTEGIGPDGAGDSYAPPKGIEALSVAIGLPRIAPGTHPVDEAAWAGISDISLGVDGLRGNLAGGRATGALAQFAPRLGHDGHFVVFEVPEARKQAATFLQSLAADSVAKITP